MSKTYLKSDHFNGGGSLTQYLLTTTDDFATTNLLTLGSETNATPAATFSPYLGDFFDLTNVGNTFYGTFCASNQDDGTNASLNSATTFLRNHSGIGTANFQLLDTGGSPVANSIDPYVFSCQLLTAPTVSFGPPTFQLNAPSAGGWSSQNLYPRELADINHDGNADIVGFASNGVFVSLANGTGGFQAPAFANGTSFWGAQTGGWSSENAFPRLLADINHDSNADIVGFATNGVYVGLANGTGGFSAPAFAPGTSFWGAQTGGWSSQVR